MQPGRVAAETVRKGHVTALELWTKFCLIRRQPPYQEGLQPISKRNFVNLTLTACLTCTHDEKARIEPSNKTLNTLDVCGDRPISDKDCDRRQKTVVSIPFGQ